MMVGRSFSSEGYRFGFNGKENDDETQTQDYGMRIYTRRLGRFSSRDPIAKKYPYLSPYQFASNSPVCGIDLDGLEFANPQLLLRKEYPVLSGISDGITTSLINTWNFFTHDAYTPEPYIAGWNLYSEFIDMATYGTSGHGPSPTPGMDAIASGVNDEIINGDSYSRSKAGAQIGTDLLTAYAGSKGLSAMALATRTSLATSFYKKFGGNLKELSGINFAKPVQITTLKKGSIVQQWVREGGEVGSYFTYEGADAAKLGINTEGRILKSFELTSDVKVLQSTTQDIAGHAGGETQLFNPSLKNSVKEITE